MSTTRRTFLKSSALAIAGTALAANQVLAASKERTLLGVQLYSVRDDMMKDALGTLKQVAAIGYKHVEHANYVNQKFYGYTAADFKKVLDDLGLKMPSGHTVMGKNHWDESKKDFTDAWKRTVEDAATVGQQYVISPWLDDSLRKSMDTLKHYMDIFNKSGELCKKSGMKFGYHNHDFEFNTVVDGMLLYDIILQNTDPSLVAQQMDIGNMYGAGGRPLDIVTKYPGRFELMHVKDEIDTGKGTMAGGDESTILGTGLLPVEDIANTFKRDGGTTHFIVEQESYQGKTPIECIKADYDVMRGWGY